MSASSKQQTNAKKKEREREREGKEGQQTRRKDRDQGIVVFFLTDLVFFTVFVLFEFFLVAIVIS